MTKETLTRLPYGTVKLLPSIFQDRASLNRRYLLSLKSDNLLQNFYQEAGLWAPRNQPHGCHWGWESPTCQVRGHFLGHWLSAAALSYANTGDTELKGKADYLVAELGRCQRENGGEWVGSIPKKYMDWLARGKPVWAPQYTLHKTLMGLYDMYAYAGNLQALDIMVNWARWFYRWSGQFKQEHFDDILDVETGGMLEVWANLYGVSGDREHLELMHRYYRRRLFDPLVAGKDVLTNMHANTTIPEVQGAARAWEVTGDERWRQVVEAYWRSAVTERGMYCTGGQTNGEVWSPPDLLSARLGDKTQEHCTVYNMMRLADYLLRWTGDLAYADYWERNLFNGILAQQHPESGMIAYFLPLRAGAYKRWGTPTDDFWCCHGTLVQAHTFYPNHIWYTERAGITLAQYLPSELVWDSGGAQVKIALQADAQLADHWRPSSLAYRFDIHAQDDREFTLNLRIPWWVSGKPEILVNGETYELPAASSNTISLHRRWGGDTIWLRLPKSLATCPLPDDPSTVAFLDGPVVLAGVFSPKGVQGRFELVEERILYGDPANPCELLTPDNEREWGYWRISYRTKNQDVNFSLIPLYEVRDETYGVYFPIRARHRI